MRARLPRRQPLARSTDQPDLDDVVRGLPSPLDPHLSTRVFPAHASPVHLASGSICTHVTPPASRRGDLRRSPGCGARNRRRLLPTCALLGQPGEEAVPGTLVPDDLVLTGCSLKCRLKQVHLVRVDVVLPSPEAEHRTNGPGGDLDRLVRRDLRPRHAARERVVGHGRLVLTARRRQQRVRAAQAEPEHPKAPSPTPDLVDDLPEVVDSLHVVEQGTPLVCGFPAGVFGLTHPVEQVRDNRAVTCSASRPARYR